MHTSSFSFFVSTRLTLKFHILSASLQQIMVLAGLTPLLWEVVSSVLFVGRESNLSTFIWTYSQMNTASVTLSEYIQKWLYSLWHHLNLFKSEYSLSDIIWTYSKVNTFYLISSEPIQKSIHFLWHLNVFKSEYSFWHNLNLFKSEYILSDIIWIYSKVNKFPLTSFECIQKWIHPLWHHLNLLKSEYILSDITWTY